MHIAQRRFPHICQLDRTLGARVHKIVAIYRVELGTSDDFGELLHVDGFDVDNVWRCAVNKNGVHCC